MGYFNVTFYFASGTYVQGDLDLNATNSEEAAQALRSLVENCKSINVHDENAKISRTVLFANVNYIAVRDPSIYDLTK